MADFSPGFLYSLHSFFACQFTRVSQQYSVRLCQFNFSSSHRGLSRAEKVLKPESFEGLTVREQAEGWNVLRQDFISPEDVGHHSNDGPGIKQGSDARFGVVTDEAAYLRVVGIYGLAVEFNFDGGVIVLEIAVGGQGAEVDPFTNVRVAEETVVVLIRVAVDDGFFHFASHATDGADAATLADLSTDNLAVSANEAGTLDPRVWENDDVLFDDDRATHGIEDNRGMDDCSRRDIDLGFITVHAG